MKFVFVEESWADYLYWQKTNKKNLKKINELLKDISRTPFTGLGKPEALKHKYQGYWSRRIDKEFTELQKKKFVLQNAVFTTTKKEDPFENESSFLFKAILA